MRPLRNNAPRHDPWIADKCYNDAYRIEERKKFLLQFQTILELFITLGKATSNEITQKFRTIMKKNIKISQLEIITDEISLFIRDIIAEINLLAHRTTIEYDPFGAVVFVFVSKSAATTLNEENRKELVETEKCIDILDLSDQLMDISVKNWLWESLKYRNENQNMYEPSLKMVATKQSNDRNVQRKAKKLAERWWPNIRFFPQLLYLLSQLGIVRPNGLKYTDLKNEIDKLIPSTWKVIHKTLSFDDFQIGVEDLVSLNLITSNDLDGHKVKVNEVIHYLAFHKVYDPELSMMYQYLSSTSHAKSSESIHEFLLCELPGWTKFLGGKSSTPVIQRICSQNNKIFVTENNFYSIKKHSYKIVVPWVFSLSVIE